MNVVHLLICRYVKLQYEPVYSLEKTVELFEQESMKKGENDFVEGLMFSPQEAVIMTGTLTDTYEPDKVSGMFLLFTAAPFWGSADTTNMWTAPQNDSIHT